MIVDLAADGSNMTVAAAPPLPGGTPGTLPGSAIPLTTSDVFIAVLEDKGVYQGDIAYDPNGVGQTLYTGDLSSTARPDRHAGDRELHRDQFMVGTRIQIADKTATVVTGGPYTIVDVSDKTLTLDTSLPVFNYNTATISKVTGTLVRTDGTSWLDSGFLEGQLIRVTLPDGVTDLGCHDYTTYNDAGGVTCLYKIEMITGTDSQKTNKISLTSTSSRAVRRQPYRPDELPSRPVYHVHARGRPVGMGRVLHAAGTGQPAADLPGRDVRQLVPADHRLAHRRPVLRARPGRQNLTTFPKQPHLLSGIRGPLAVEGGTTAADRSLKGAVLLPGEDNRPPFRVAAQPPEWQAIDTLNVYGDGSKEDTKGNLTSTALTGLNMGPGLDFTQPLRRRLPVQRAGQVSGRHQLRLDQPRPDHAQLHDRRDAVDARDRQHHARRR